MPGKNVNRKRRTAARPRPVDELLEISALGMICDPLAAPRDMSLAEYARRLIAERTGVTCEWPAPPSDWTLERIVRESETTGTLPHVLAVGGLLQEPATRRAVLGKGIAHEITPELIRRCMPAYAERIRRYGWSVEEVLRTNLCEGHSICVPIQFGFDEFPGLVGHPGAKAPAACYYALGMRDDVLVKILPSALTERQLQDVLAQKGSLDIHDLVDDIPLRNPEDLRRYLSRVKALGLTADDGAGPLVPGSLLASYEGLWSLYWSFASAAGYFYNRPFIVGDPPGWTRTTTYWVTTEFQKLLRWWNRIYHEGLIGDPFSLTDKENAEQIQEGRFAVINDWGWRGDGGDARRAARSRAYGYRYFPFFYGRWVDIWDNYTQPVEHREIPLVFTRRLKNQADLARVMRWADWHMSEERDAIAYWGMPGWYTGTGAARRYTWKSADIEDWAVYGIRSERDGAVLGLEHTPAVEWDPSRTVKVPLGPLSFFAPESAYPEAPYWVYPRDGRKVLRTNDFRDYCANVAKATRFDEYLVMYRGQHHREKLYSIPEVKAYFIATDPPPLELSALLRDAIVAPLDRFEKTCDAIRRYLVDRGYEKARQAFIAYMKDVYPTQIEPNIFVDRRKR